MPDLMGSFASAYQQGAAIRDDMEKQRLYKDTQSTFAEVIKNKDQYGGDEGALKEAARRFGESGNVQGFQMATQQAAGIRAEEEKRKEQALGHLGKASLWLYGIKDDAKKQAAYEKLYNHYKGMTDVSNWPKPGSYTDEIGLALTNEKESVSYLNNVARVDQREAEADIKEKAQKLREEKFEWEKTHPKASGGRGGGTATSAIQIAEYMANNKFRDENGKLYTKQTAFDKAAEFLTSAKTMGAEAWIQKHAPLLGLKAAKKMRDELYGADASKAPAAGGKEDWRTYAK